MTSINVFGCCEMLNPYEHMNNWKKLDETSLLGKKILTAT